MIGRRRRRSVVDRVRPRGRSHRQPGAVLDQRTQSRRRNPPPGPRPATVWLSSPPVEQYLPIVLLLVLVALVRRRIGADVTPPRAQTTDRRQGRSLRVGYRAPLPAGRPLPDVRFYLVAMIFIIFDIEVIFLYPWAVMYHQLWTFGLAEMAVFAVVVFIAFAYLVSNGALDWGPRVRTGGRPPGRPVPNTTAHGPPGPPTAGSCTTAAGRDRRMPGRRRPLSPSGEPAHTG